MVIARASEAQETRVNISDDTTTPFKIGDSVEITNSITSPVNRIADINDRRGTIYKITKKRIFIRTINGGNTRRAPQNLKHHKD